ncbi:MAG: NlpC/P60 family protein, partial [Chloroflexi bacterium]|nr:NlpC/P60 family protein [Chloroflexota bacterium]
MTSDQIHGNAQALLGIRYLWGGDSDAGMDCSAYVSKVWGVSRHTTDSLYLVSSPISKDELRPGDALNLIRSEDPRGYGHVRLFAAWANDDRTRMWVYEETPPQSVYYVIAYDARYTPMRRANFEPVAEAPVVAAPAPAVGRSGGGQRPARPTPTAVPESTSGG